MTHVFDPRSILLARHAQHVVLIHFPIALFLIGVLIDLSSRVTKNSSVAAAARLNLTAAAISIVPVYLTGWLAWHFALEGHPIRGVLLYHVVAASITSALVLSVCWLRSRMRVRLALVLFLELVAAISISITAHLGGFLSGVNN